MTRQYWKPANLLNPVPAVLIGCCDNDGNANVMTAAWAGTVCSDPVMVSVSIRKERYSHHMIAETGEFTVNLVSRSMAKAADFAGVRSGRDIDKFAQTGDLKLTKQKSNMVNAPSVAESPVVLECRVKQIIELGSHDMFIGEVVCTGVHEELIDSEGKLDLKKADLVAYSHGEYYALGDYLGKFGFSVRKPRKKKMQKKEGAAAPKRKNG